MDAGKPCSADAIFDGRRRYDLIANPMASTGCGQAVTHRIAGETVNCRLTIEKAGFKNDDDTGWNDRRSQRTHLDG